MSKKVIHATRLQALACTPDVGLTAAKPPKWLVALNLTPMAEQSEDERHKPTPGATVSPYALTMNASAGVPTLLPPPGPVPQLMPAGSLRKRPASLVQKTQGGVGQATADRLIAESQRAIGRQGAELRFGPSKKRRKTGDGISKSGAKRPRRRHLPPRMDCWFCVASPACEKHLIVSVGEHVYLTAPKGAISPGHMIMVPISHDESFSQVSSETAEEVERYKQSLRAFYASHNEVPLFIERSVKTKGPQQHAYIEVIPLPAETAAKTLPSAFADACKKANMDFKLMNQSDALHSSAPEDHQYYHIEMPSRVQLLYAVPPSRGTGGSDRVPLQFGRQLACRVLACPQRTHWKSCIVSPREEMRLANEFKMAFLPHDFTMQASAAKPASGETSKISGT